MRRPRAWDLEFYTDQRGRSPVKEFLRELDRTVRSGVMHDLDVALTFGLENTDTELIRHVSGKIWEVRSGRVRLLFAPIRTDDGRAFLLLVGFIKDTRKTPPEEIKRAKDRLKDWLARNRQ